uniref:Beta-1,4-galactosyltransferase n=1 Tax=Xiphophorus couchianus TaxID=32473 RepID=A0A3B5LCN3_9TELE
PYSRQISIRQKYSNLNAVSTGLGLLLYELLHQCGVAWRMSSCSSVSGHEQWDMCLPCVESLCVAVIIPFRNRYEHLTHWLHYVHPVLMRQQLDYGVYVINQDGDGAFNRAKLMNIGFVEALIEYDYDCFVFSDVDLVPIDDRNLYRCSDHPRHLSVAVDKFNFILPYATIFGGVSALSKQQFLKVNGFSNTFWGWGGEDDDMSQRISYRRMFISRPDSVTGRYKMIQHERDSHNDPNPRRVQKLTETYSNMDKDGLNSLNYTVREIRKDLLYTFVTVDVQADVDSRWIPGRFQRCAWQQLFLQGRPKVIWGLSQNPPSY